MTESQLLSDQQIPFADFPTEELRYSGILFDALVINDAGNLELEDGGFIDNPIIRVAIERSQFEESNITIPPEGQGGIAFRRQSWRVSNPSSSDMQGSVILDLVTENK